MQAHWERSAAGIAASVESEIETRLGELPWPALGFRLLRRQFAGAGVPGLGALVWLARQARRVVRRNG